MKKPERLYGLPGAEIMYESIDEITTMYPGERLTIEEWTVTDNRDLLPSADRLMEWMIEMADPVTEHWWDTAENVAVDPDIQGVFDAAIELFASKIRYWMADRVVATHTVGGNEPPSIRTGGAR